jgi:hypothetical protein
MGDIGLFCAHLELDIVHQCRGQLGYELVEQLQAALYAARAVVHLVGFRVAGCGLRV